MIELAFPIDLNKLVSSIKCVSLSAYTLKWVFQRLPVTQCAGIMASGIVGGNAFELPSLLFDLNTCILDGISPSSS